MQNHLALASSADCHSPLDSASDRPKSKRRGATMILPRPINNYQGVTNMIMGFADPFDTLLDLQRSLEATLANDWLQDLTTSRGPFPPINVFQQGDDILAIIELPGVSKSDLQIEAKENSIRIFGKKAVDYPEEASLHRRERVSGEFDRTLSFPVQIEADGIKAEFRDGILAVFLPRAESDKPRNIKIT
jgi:HSP20 family protein